MSDVAPSNLDLPSGRGGAPHGGEALEGGGPENAYGNYFVAAYPPFSQWSPEACGAFRELLSRPAESGTAAPLGLYVHIPFCVERCRYCYYLSLGGAGGGELGRYLDVLPKELALYADSGAIGPRPLDFVYFGGGTPSLLSETLLDRLLARLQEVLSWDATREVTFESAPKSVTRPKMERLRRLGVTRLSLGVQQLDDDVLGRNGRVHLVRDVLRAYEAVRGAGFEVVNIDLMVGMVGETEETLLGSLDRVIELEPDSVTLYQMEIPRNTPLYRDLESGEESAAALADWEEKHRRLALAFERLAEAGYEPISGYTMVRDRSRHGFVYQHEQYHGADLLGIGASAFGYLQGTHYQNAPSLGSYVELIEAGELPLLRAYRLNDEERLLRELVLQLKLGGVERDYFRGKFGVDIVEQWISRLIPLAERGWVRWDDSRLSLTPQGLVRVDHLVRTLYPAEHRDVRYS